MQFCAISCFRPVTEAEVQPAIGSKNRRMLRNLRSYEQQTSLQGVYIFVLIEIISLVWDGREGHDVIGTEALILETDASFFRFGEGVLGWGDEFILFKNTSLFDIQF